MTRFLILRPIELEFNTFYRNQSTDSAPILSTYVMIIPPFLAEERGARMIVLHLKQRAQAGSPGL